MMISWKLVSLTCCLVATCALASTISPATTSSSGASATSAPDVGEPTTLLADDSLAVNADETPSTIVVNDDKETSSELASLPGIESKSISGSAPNSLPDASQDEPSAKLTVATPSTDDAPLETASPEVPTNLVRQVATKLNISQLNQIYNQAHKDERETVESWQRMGKKLKKGVGNLIGSLVPYALNMSQEAKISSNCSGAMLKWVLSMNQLKSWALRMLDASGKPIAGLLEGSLTMFGNYRECLKIRAPDDDEIDFSGEFREYFRGKYCIVQAKPWLPEKSRFYNLNTKLKGLMENEEGEVTPWYEKTVFDELSEWALAFNFVNIRMDICVPSLCTVVDLNKAINFLLRGIDLKARVLRCEMHSPSSSHRLLGASSMIESGTDDDLLGALNPTISAGLMDSSSSPMSQALTDPSNESGSLNVILGWLLVPTAAIVVVLLATLVSYAIGDRDEAALIDDSDLDTSTGSNAGFGSNSRLGSKSRIDLRVPNKLTRTINSLSLKRSVSSHLNVDYDQLADDKPLALYGIRFVLVLWVILVESAVNLKFEFLRELLMLKNLIFWWPMQLVINSSLQFDSFILLTAFTMAYKNVLNDSVRGIKNITRFVVDKYIRLMPSIMVMVAIVILMPLVYSGPVWNDYVSKQSAVCQTAGWLNAAFIQNYLPYKEICLPQTWLLCIELQLVVLMAPLVYHLNKAYLKNQERNKMIVFLNKDSSKIDNNSRKREGDANKPLFWLRTIPGILLLASIIVGLSASFYNVYSNQLPPSWFYTMADPDSKALYFGAHMMRLWTHLAVFAMGILAGVECRRASRNIQRGYRGVNLAVGQASQKAACGGLRPQNKSQSSSSSSLPVMASQASSNSPPNEYNTVTGSSISINIMSAADSSNRSSRFDVDRASKGTGSCVNLVLDVLGCMAAVAIMIAIIFSTHDWSLNDLPEPLVAGAFDATSRFLWSLATIWILYLISVPDKDKKFSVLSRALGHPVMVSLGKLSFLIYIIHPIVHTAVLAIQEQPIYSSWLMLFHILIGNMTITVILASLVSLFVEMPCRNIFRRCRTSLLLSHVLESSPTNTPVTPNYDTTAT